MVTVRSLSRRLIRQSLAAAGVAVGLLASDLPVCAQWNSLAIDIRQTEGALPTSPLRCWHKPDGTNIDDVVYLGTTTPGLEGFCKQQFDNERVQFLDDGTPLIMGYGFTGVQDNSIGDSIVIMTRPSPGTFNNNPSPTGPGNSSMVLHFYPATSDQCPSPPCNWTWNGSHGAGAGLAKTPIPTAGGYKYFAAVVVSYYNKAQVGLPYDWDHGVRTSCDMSTGCCAYQTTNNPARAWLTWAVSADGLTWRYVDSTGTSTTDDPRNSLVLLARSDRQHSLWVSDAACATSGRWSFRFGHVGLQFNRYDNYFYIVQTWWTPTSPTERPTWWRMQFDPYNSFGLGQMWRLSGADQNSPAYQWVDASCQAGAAGCGTIPANDNWVAGASFPNSADPHVPAGFAGVDVMDLSQLYNQLGASSYQPFGGLNYDSTVLTYQPMGASSVAYIKGTAARTFPFFDTAASGPKSLSVAGLSNVNAADCAPPPNPPPGPQLVQYGSNSYFTALQQNGFTTAGGPSLFGYVAGKRTMICSLPDYTVDGLIPVTFALGSSASPTPVISGLQPDSGPATGSTYFTLSGSGFASGGAAVMFGSGSATNEFVVPGGTVLTGNTPAGAAGTIVDVTMTNVNGQKGKLWDSFLYDFTDVQSGHLNHGDVVRIARAHVTSGCGGGSYCASLSVTRGQMSVFLLKSKYDLVSYVAPPVPPSGTGFTDVLPGDQFAPWIVELVREGISSGCGGGKFCPGASTTRQEMAVFLLKAIHGSGFVPPACTTPAIFADVACPSTYANWIEKAYRDGIMLGNFDASGKEGCAVVHGFCPGAPVLRAPMATLLVRAFGL